MKTSSTTLADLPRIMYIMDMLIPVEISSFAIDPQKSVPLIVLKETGGARSFAIPVDPVEACAIALHSLQVQVDKPFTIDLVKIVIEQLGGELYRTIIGDFEDGVFSASVAVKAGASIKVIDCRPCDAVALAMRCGAPMFAKEVVFAKLCSGSGLSAEEELRARVRAVDAVDFGRFVIDL